MNVMLIKRQYQGIMCVQDVCTQRRCTMTTTKVFKNGNSQAIRIPQNMRTDQKDFFIQKIGEIFIAYPTDDPWACTRQAIGAFPDDFMNDREQPSWKEVSSREDL